jgi:hypothetical protein
MSIDQNQDISEIFDHKLWFLYIVGLLLTWLVLYFNLLTVSNRFGVLTGFPTVFNLWKFFWSIFPLILSGLIFLPGFPTVFKFFQFSHWYSIFTKYWVSHSFNLKLAGWPTVFGSLKLQGVTQFQSLEIDGCPTVYNLCKLLGFTIFNLW